MSKYPPSHKPPGPYEVRIPLSGYLVVKVMSSGNKEAKEAAMTIAKEAAAEITASAELTTDTEEAVDDWKISIPNRKGIEISKVKKVRKR